MNTSGDMSIRPGTFDYGFRPPKLHQQIVDKINQIGSRRVATDRNETN
jgi:hypothetical protein